MFANVEDKKKNLKITPRILLNTEVKLIIQYALYRSFYFEYLKVLVNFCVYTHNHRKYLNFCS